MATQINLTTGTSSTVVNLATGGRGPAGTSVDLASPSPIGSTTPNTGAFTDLSATGTATLPHIHGSIAGNLYIHVRNTSGGPLARGTPVYITGNVGSTDRVTVAAADNTNTAKMPAVGLLGEDLSNNGDGNAVIIGELTAANTNSYAVHQELYVGVGALTGTKPTTGEVQPAGVVARVNTNTGVIVVNMQGRRTRDEVFVPYTGATGDVDLGENGLEAAQVSSVGESLHIDLVNHSLNDSSTKRVDWENSQLNSGNGSANALSVDWANRKLVAANGITEMLDWSDPDGNGIIDAKGNVIKDIYNLADASDAPSVNVNARSLADSTGGVCSDWENRQLLGSDGSTVIADWSATDALELPLGAKATGGSPCTFPAAGGECYTDANMPTPADIGAATEAQGSLADSALQPSATQTLTNKRITARVTTITSSATPTINTDNCDCVTITALAEAITSMTTNLSGTPSNFDQLLFRIKDNGTARAITWGAAFTACGGILPTTTVANKLWHVLFIRDTVTNTWECVSSSLEV